ncbi:hypothetical protein FOA52_013813 [Chlamydomonas sp. UWO 241]|nr:hypothetical protein FOA52_013813 [Chlamydomonas sp. UWO 241]
MDITLKRARAIQCSWLARTLVLLLRETLPPSVTFLPGTHVSGLEEESCGSGRVVVRLEGRDAPLTTELLVAAEGLFSPVRRQLLDDGPPNFMGTVVFRALVTEAQVQLIRVMSGITQTHQSNEWHHTDSSE